MKRETPATHQISNRAPTIRDVAAAVGMHKSTVSLALAGKGEVAAKTRARVEAAARALGYVPNPTAQRLATNGTGNSVYLCAEGLDVGITTQKILLIQSALAQRGLDAPIYTLFTPQPGSPNSRAAQMRQLCRQQPRAIVYSGPHCPPAVICELEAYQEHGGIVINYDQTIALDCDQVVFDRWHNAYVAARYLIVRGHTEIGLAMSSVRRPDGTENPAQRSRSDGFLRALEDAGLTPHPQWHLEQVSYETGGAELAAKFLTLPHRPTGLCIVNDYTALAFMTETLRAGFKIPADISLVGHDNRPVAAYCPVPLTCATQPDAEIAAIVVQLLTERLDGYSGTARTRTIRGEIVERSSVCTL